MCVSPCAVFVSCSRRRNGPQLSASSQVPESGKNSGEMSGLIQSSGALVAALREAEQAIGAASYAPSPHESPGRVFRRSLIVVKDVAEGERLTKANVRSVGLAHGLPPEHLPGVLGRPASSATDRGTLLSRALVGKREWPWRSTFTASGSDGPETSGYGPNVAMIENKQKPPRSP